MAAPLIEQDLRTTGALPLATAVHPDIEVIDGPSGAVAEPDVAITHDYLTQRGGAERVVLSMTRAFPGAAVHTSLFDPDGTFPEFGGVDVRTSPLNGIGLVRRHHRLGLPLYPAVFRATAVDADVVVCSSSGWAHGVVTEGAKVVYCHTPARWLYARDSYLGGKRAMAAKLATPLRPLLRTWDRRAAGTATRYLANSKVVQQRIRDAYGVEAEVLAPPPAVDVEGEHLPIDGVEPGYQLLVGRLLAYKNVDAVLAAFEELPDERLLIIGVGPDGDRLRAAAPRNVHFAGAVDDATVRWAYTNAKGLISVAIEDFGLVPLEGATFGLPTLALRKGGFLDTVVQDLNGHFIDEATPSSITAGLRQMAGSDWSEADIRLHADLFSEARFRTRLRQIVNEVAAN